MGSRLPLSASGPLKGRGVALPSMMDLLDDQTLFTIKARSVGKWGNTIAYDLSIQSPGDAGDNRGTVFTLSVFVTNRDGELERVETFRNLSLQGTQQGTKRVDAAINDPYSGSRYISIEGLSLGARIVPPDSETPDPVHLSGGVNPDRPNQADLLNSSLLVDEVEGPVMLNTAGYLADANAENTDEYANAYVGTVLPASALPHRDDIFVINDNCPPRANGQSAESYKNLMMNGTYLGADIGNSYSASYGPWIIIPNPRAVGTTIQTPPGGAVMGVAARIDSTIGFFRAPAGVIAGISNAVGVQTKFRDLDLGELNNSNINVIRPVVGAGIAIMGARTRKTFGTDRYISARRTLIYLKQVLRTSTQFAVFENNDQLLWASLRMSADRILRPLWEAGGLRGANSAEAYYIRCDAAINTPDVIASGEVRMEVGVALEYPAEFVVIKLTQFERGGISSEVQANY